MVETVRPRGSNLLGKVLVALGLVLVVYLAFRFVIGLIKWLLIVVAAVVLLWFGVRLLIGRPPDE
ncbi:MAG: hypothetical protein H0U28_07045 [Nocardioidaceae bacterium]|nr:hypothetical protein [Nocardioidaceae bacterium]